MSTSRCHYEVFCPENAPSAPAPDVLLKVLAPHLKWSRVTPKTDSARWAAPKFLVGDSLSRQPPRPLSGAQATHVGTLMKKLGACFVITAEGKTMAAFQASIALVWAAADYAGAELIVDRTASLGLLPADARRQNELIQKSEVEPVEGVTAHLKGTSLTTTGLCKYGVRELSLDHLDTGDVGIAHELIYERLLRPSLAGLKKGQIISYKQNDPAAVLYVELGTDDRFHISDCDAKRGAPIAGLKRYITSQSHSSKSDPRR